MEQAAKAIAGLKSTDWKQRKVHGAVRHNAKVELASLIRAKIAAVSQTKAVEGATEVTVNSVKAFEGEQNEQ